MGDGCRSSFVQRLLDHCLDCGPDLANSSNMGSNLSIIADLQSGHPTLDFHKNKVELLSIFEISRVLKPLSAVFLS